jgi:hypothetical protein
MGVTDERKYLADMNALAVVCQLLPNVDLDFLANTIQHAHAVGPMTMPSEYKEALRDLRAQEKLVAAAKDLQAVFEEIGGHCAWP